ncbi:hypothetical protein CBR_g39013 [Chara braunii]|uniref:Uncharacterized protein n=1 Tax=Chara braunii TaxID=69332 RepID=A0A388K0X8_CHABU|nr:hypothetical protein CBR_g39013 [Chara braunii]|eukprot:GBG63702.1 hypothetical protein CBR_g39013 [Chara braunii]
MHAAAAPTCPSALATHHSDDLTTNVRHPPSSSVTSTGNQRSVTAHRGTGGCCYSQGGFQGRRGNARASALVDEGAGGRSEASGRRRAASQGRDGAVFVAAGGRVAHVAQGACARQQLNPGGREAVAAATRLSCESNYCVSWATASHPRSLSPSPAFRCGQSPRCASSGFSSLSSSVCDGRWGISGSLRSSFLRGSDAARSCQHLFLRDRAENMVHVQSDFRMRAMVTTGSPAQGQQTRATFVLDGHGELEVLSSSASDGKGAHIEFKISGWPLVEAPVLLHWGATKEGQNVWVLPPESQLPRGTRNYKERALQTPFKRSGDKAILALDFPDASAYSGIEFLLKDDSKNHWYKFNGGNFRVAIPGRKSNQVVQVPDDLVSVQAYLRWEKNGRQNYSAEQQQREYEIARSELENEVRMGMTIEQLARKLLGPGADTGRSTKGSARTYEERSVAQVPEDLVQIQAFLRWERAGKPNYSLEKQQSEYQEARRDLEAAVAKGNMSIDALRHQLVKGDGIAMSNKPDSGTTAPPLGRKGGSRRIQRKNWNLDEIVNRHAKRVVRKTDDEEAAEVLKGPPGPVGELSPLDLGAQVMEGADQGVVVLKKTHVLPPGSKLLILVTNHGGEVRVHIASDSQEELILHWGMTKDKMKVWKTPPTGLRPEGTFETAGGSCETHFKRGFAGDLSLQSVELVIPEAEASDYTGLSFVVRRGSEWFKDKNFADFHAPLAPPSSVAQHVSDGKGTCKWLLDQIADSESDAERSLMHRFNLAAGFLQAAKSEGELALAAVFIWLRFMATRQLIWNKNYNVKPRELSAAQDRLTDGLQQLFVEQPHFRELARMMLSTVGRGGQGDVGQRIRDEILVIQQNNSCKGGMMEEWHQKLHNNTTPDDVVICQALIDFINSGFQMDAYWKTLNSNGVTRERLASFDRPIVSEPRFSRDQANGLVRDLSSYMKTLKAVHSGADLESAIAVALGYKLEGCRVAKTVEIQPIGGLPRDLNPLLEYVLANHDSKDVVSLLEALVEARREIRPSLLKASNRLKDIIYLDLALDSAVRTAVERGMENVHNVGAADVIYLVALVLENLCLSTDDNLELVYCLKIDIFAEEVVRAGSAASLSILLNRLNPMLRAAADMGSWQIISPHEARGFVEVVDALGPVQHKEYGRPTVLLAGRVMGEEEIPSGVVALLTPDMPDILSHVSVRARNGKVCFATCFDRNTFSDLQALKDRAVRVAPKSSADLEYSEIAADEVRSVTTGGDDESDVENGFYPDAKGINIEKKKFLGRFAISADEFTSELVGAKSRNIVGLRGKLPSWIKLPNSVALPFGVFEKVLSDKINKDVAKEIEALSKELHAGDLSKLKEIRKAVLGLKPPQELVTELREKMISSGMPWPGDAGEQRWEEAWLAIKRVWASKWNERAYLSTRKAKINHDLVCMAVLVQEIVQADYAFVIHTTNPSNDDASEIYAEVVKGLGETLVGAYPGRALSAVAKKSNVHAPKVVGFPSKRVGLFTPPSIIFRSDSNGEDLEGYAGAGLYDSVPMDANEEKFVDYSTDPLATDNQFQQRILSKIIEAGYLVEQVLGSAQDIEGCIKKEDLCIVQTRPQM